jgi:hypothetical protein
MTLKPWITSLATVSMFTVTGLAFAQQPTSQPTPQNLRPRRTEGHGHEHDEPGDDRREAHYDEPSAHGRERDRHEYDKPDRCRREAPHAVDELWSAVDRRISNPPRTRQAR